jgi:thioredoxin 1
MAQTLSGVKMEQLSKKTFSEKIFDYEKKKEWQFQGTLPAIVDFYADWCGPCKAVGPILEKLAVEYEGKVSMYKVNTDQEQELATAFGIMTIPSLMFIPMQGQPQMTRGALSREVFVKMITDVLGVK